MRAVCDGLERCCGVSVVCSVCGNGCVCGVRCLLEIFECLVEVTRALEGTHVCDCGIAWRLMVLGVQQCWAGARMVRGGSWVVEEKCWMCGFVMWL